MKILIADDSAVLRMAVRKLLEPEGYEVVTAEDGVEGITQFYQEAPDLVLLDVQMPKLSGYVVCRIIKEDPAAAHIPVLILTVRDSAEDRYWGAKSGADGYLTKDALGDELLAAIRSALASQALRELSGDGMDSVQLDGDTDVLTRVCEVLDRKLFEATVVNEITSVAVQPMSLDGTVEEMLSSLQRLVAFDAGAIIFPDEKLLDLHIGHQLAPEDLSEFQKLCAEHISELTGKVFDVAELDLHRLNAIEGAADPPRGWGSFTAVPLNSRGQLVGDLVLAAHAPKVFGEAAMQTLRTITPPIAAVADSARNFQHSVEAEARQAFSSLF